MLNAKYVDLKSKLSHVAWCLVSSIVGYSIQCISIDTAEEVKCDRSVRRVAKRWIEEEDDHDEDEDH